MVLKWFKNLKDGLSKSSEKISGGIKKIFKNKKVDQATLNQLEELLISSDLGVKISSQIVEELRKSKMLDPTVDKIKQIIKKKLVNILYPLEKL